MGSRMHASFRNSRMKYWGKTYAVFIILAGPCISLSCKRDIAQPTKQFFDQDCSAWVELTYENSKCPTILAGTIRSGGQWRYEIMGSNHKYRVFVFDGQRIECGDGGNGSNIASRIQQNVMTSLWENVAQCMMSSNITRTTNSGQYEYYLTSNNQELAINVDTGLIANYGSATAKESIVYLSLSKSALSLLMTTNEHDPLLLKSVADYAKRHQLVPGSILKISSTDASPTGVLVED